MQAQTVPNADRFLGKPLILTFPEVPALEFELIQRLDQPPLGVGEAASTPVPAALANAVFDATGVRLRTVPFRAERVKAALARG
jgi:CO/xanthine dehydrogenase Mo-binding subunit